MDSDAERGVSEASPGSTSTPTLPSPIEGEGFEGALDALRRAEAEMAGFRAAEPEGVSFEVQWALDEHFSDLCVAFNRALVRLMLVPAPDLPAFGLKVVLAVDHEVATLTGGEEAMAQLKADAERLTSRSGASRRV